MGTIIILALIVGAIYLVIKMANKSKTKDKAVTCPKCKTVNTFQPGPCENCGSPDTWREYQYSSDAMPFIKHCRTCKSTVPMDAVCENCGTDLRGIVQGGKGRAALLAAAAASQKHR